MEKSALNCSMTLVLFVISFAGLAPGYSKAPQGKTETFLGEIYDGPCAKAGSHSPMDEMMDAKGDPTKCTLECVKVGAKFVLFDSAKKAIYQLDDQQKPKDFAGQKVKVTGTYDAATKTIHVETIEAAK